MNKANQKGFAAVEGLLLFIVVLLIGGTGLYLQHSSNNANKIYDHLNSPAKSQKGHTGKVITKQYYSTYAGAYFSYPSNWQGKNALNLRQAQKDAITLISPSGKVRLDWDSNILGVGSPPCSVDVPPGAKDAAQNLGGCPLWRNTAITPLAYGHGLSLVLGYSTGDNQRFEPYIAVQAADSPLITDTRGAMFSFYNFKDLRSELGAAPDYKNGPSFPSAEAALDYLRNDSEMQTAQKIVASLSYK